MTNFLLKNPDAVFIHIHKTGGTSIRKGVWKGRQRGQAMGHIPGDWDRSLLRFAFVRDPLSRFLSVWRMFTQGTENYPGDVLVRNPSTLTLDEFFDIVRDESIVYDHRRKTNEERIRHHAIPQTHPFNCLREARFVGRYETLAEDFARVARHLRIPPALPRLNTTGTQPEDPDGTLGPRLAAAVRDYYREDYRFLEHELPRYRTLP